MKSQVHDVIIEPYFKIITLPGISPILYDIKILSPDGDFFSFFFKTNPIQRSVW